MRKFKLIVVLLALASAGLMVAETTSAQSQDISPALTASVASAGGGRYNITVGISGYSTARRTPPPGENEGSYIVSRGIILTWCTDPNSTDWPPWTVSSFTDVPIPTALYSRATWAGSAPRLDYMGFDTYFTHFCAPNDWAFVSLDGVNLCQNARASVSGDVITAMCRDDTSRFEQTETNLGSATMMIKDVTIPANGAVILMGEMGGDGTPPQVLACRVRSASDVACDTGNPTNWGLSGGRQPSQQDPPRGGDSDEGATGDGGSSDDDRSGRGEGGVSGQGGASGEGGVSGDDRSGRSAATPEPPPAGSSTQQYTPPPAQAPVSAPHQYNPPPAAASAAPDPEPEADGVDYGAEVAMRDSLVADQESLLNIYRCRFGVDVDAVPGGCVDGAPAEGATQPGALPPNPTQADIDARDDLIARQEAALNDYRCRFDVDTHLVPGGCG